MTRGRWEKEKREKEEWEEKWKNSEERVDRVEGEADLLRKEIRFVSFIDLIIFQSCAFFFCC